MPQSEAYGFLVNYKHRCAATLIDRQWILTAAHCNMTKGDDVDLSRWNVAASSELGAQRRQIVECHVHPDHNPQTEANDVAICKLDYPAKNGTPTIRPPRDEEENDYAFSDGRYFTVSGWGKSSTGSRSPYMRTVNVPLVSNAVCADAYKTSSRVVTSAHVCAGAENLDACEGDSGAPLFLVISTNGNIEFVQFGIVSFGQGCGLAGFPGVYTRVWSHKEFIYRWVPGLQNFVENRPTPAPTFIGTVPVTPTIEGSCRSRCSAGISTDQCECSSSCVLQNPITCCLDYGMECLVPKSPSPVVMSQSSDTCNGNCNGGTVSGCFCDGRCRFAADCCDDVTEACGYLHHSSHASLSSASLDSCANLCGGKASDCYCDKYTQNEPHLCLQWYCFPMEDKLG